MNKAIYFLFITIITFVTDSFAQRESFDVFTYQPPEFFTKSVLPTAIQYHLKNNDTSFCTIILYNSQPAKADAIQDILSQWNKQVVKRLTKADKKPGRILTEQLWDGWASTLAIGNFYYYKKKCVVMLNSFRKEKNTVCAVFAFSDNNFKGVVENFSANLHLKNKVL